MLQCNAEYLKISESLNITEQNCILFSKIAKVHNSVSCQDAQSKHDFIVIDHKHEVMFYLVDRLTVRLESGFKGY